MIEFIIGVIIGFIVGYSFKKIIDRILPEYSDVQRALDISQRSKEHCISESDKKFMRKKGIMFY